MVVPKVLGCLWPLVLTSLLIRLQEPHMRKGRLTGSLDHTSKINRLISSRLCHNKVEELPQVAEGKLTRV